MRFTFEKYSGSGSRHTCPACGRKKKFSRYIDTETGQYIADHVGRCDRETSCGYHFKPKEYFADNPYSKPDNCGFFGSFPAKRRTGISWQGRTRKNGSQAIYGHLTSTKRPDFIDRRHLIDSIGNYEQNAFVKFLFGLFPFTPEDVIPTIIEYKIGTGSRGETIYWQIDSRNRIRTGKLIAYDRQTGKRRKDRSANWIHSQLKKAGLLPDSFSLHQCFFGEHLLTKYPGGTIAIVEAEKTALIASMCKRAFPEFVWLACGGLSNLKADKLERIGRGRKILLFPDLKAFGKWQEHALEARKRGIDVHISDLLETLATSDQMDKGLDLADYLIAEQQRRNDPANRAAFQDLIEERLAIMTIDGGMSLSDAESYLEQSGFVEYAEKCVLASA